MPPSAAVTTLLSSRAADLPETWWLGAEPSPRARQEAAWACAYRIVSRLLFRDPLPTELRVGREACSIPISTEAWSELEAELGLTEPEARRSTTELLGRIIRRDPRAHERPVTLPPCAAGLVVLVDGLSREARGVRRGPGRRGLAAPDPTLLASLRGDAEAARRELLVWAGGSAEDDRLDVIFHVLWRPLSRRAWDTPVSTPDQATTLDLPPSFLRRTPAEATAPPPESPTYAADPSWRSETRQEARAEPLFEHRPPQARADASLVQVLTVLAEPLLSVRCASPDGGLPSSALDGADAPQLAADLLRAWRRLLLTGEVELYGNPGSLIELELPDRAWRLDDGPFRPRVAEGRGLYRVTRRGIRCRGVVVQAATVIAERRGR